MTPPLSPDSASAAGAGTHPGQEANQQLPRHAVQFYSDATFLVDSLSRFMGSVIGAGDSGVVIARPWIRDQLASRLTGRGFNLEKTAAQGRYVALDAAETLGRFLRNGWPDEKLFVEFMGPLITRAKAAAGGEHARVALFGEMVALLWGDGKTEAALRLEELWNQIAQSHSFSLLCAYPLSSFYLSDHSDTFLKICAEHSAVLPAENYTLASENERQRIVAGWQQRALALEAEIAQHNEAEEAARKLAAIVESSEDAIVSKDLNGIVTSWNVGAERIFEYKAEEMIGQSITKIIPAELRSDEDMILGKMRRGEHIDHFETVRVTKTGKRIDVSLTISPIRDAHGRVIGAAKIARDISRRKRTEEALRHAEKLAAAGQLAAAIAHEINNPMQALANLLALVMYKTTNDEETHRLVAMAETQLTRMSHITRQMLSFYRESPASVPLNIAEAVDEILELQAASLRARDIRVERRYELDQPVPVYAVETRQLLSNLLFNAAEAVGRGGRILVHLSLSRDWKRRDVRGVRIVIADSGPGIAPAIRERIFEPFFTTKAERGTGLGLWVVRGIIAKHGGSLRLRTSTAAGRTGTVFSVFLPTEGMTREPGKKEKERESDAAD